MPPPLPAPRPPFLARLGDVLTLAAPAMRAAPPNLAMRAARAVAHEGGRAAVTRAASTCQLGWCTPNNAHTGDPAPTCCAQRAPSSYQSCARACHQSSPAPSPTAQPADCAWLDAAACSWRLPRAVSGAPPDPWTWQMTYTSLTSMTLPHGARHLALWQFPAIAVPLARCVPDKCHIWRHIREQSPNVINEEQQTNVRRITRVRTRRKPAHRLARSLRYPQCASCGWCYSV